MIEMPKEPVKARRLRLVEEALLDTFAWCQDGILPFFYFVVLGSFLACCATAQLDAGARASLNMLSAAVGPTSKIARQGCDDRIDLIVAQIETDKDLTADQGKARIIEVREKCGRVKATFDRIRALHDEARKLVDSERWGEAMSKLNAAQREFDDLKPLLENP
jgi:hypothetical protein